MFTDATNFCVNFDFASVNKKLSFQLNSELSAVEMDSSDDDEFFFESSHLALRCNSDYLKIIRHLTVLCKSRLQVNNDIEILKATQKKALDNPSTFVEQLRRGSLDLPAPTVIEEVRISDCFQQVFINI